MFDVIFSEDFFLGLTTAFALFAVICFVAICADMFKKDKKTTVEPVKEMKKPIVVKASTIKVEDYDFVTEAMFQEKCPYAEGTIRADYWHEVTGR